MATIFGQQNYTGELGTGHGATIHDFGCALCSIAMALVNCFGKQTDPNDLNQKIINVGGYGSNGAGANDEIVWNCINQIYSDISLAFNNLYPSTPADMNLIDGQLTKGMSVIVGVSFEHDVNATSPTHYVEIYKKDGDGTYHCRDPWYADDTSFNARYAVNGMSVAQCILQVVSYNGPVVSQGISVDSKIYEMLVTNSTANDSVCDELSLAHNAGGPAELAAIRQLKLDNTNNQTTITNLNKQIPDLEGQITILGNTITSLTQQLKIAQSASVHPDSGLNYMDLYNQANSDLITTRQQLADQMATNNRAMAQYQNTSALLMDKWQLLRIAIARLVGLPVQMTKGNGAGPKS